MGEEIGQHTRWYYNVITGKVEREGEGKGTDHLGPYPSREAAESALADIRVREKQLSDEDARWSGNADA